MLLDFFESSDIKTGKFCTGEEKSLSFYVNGKQYHSDLSQYVFEQNDRILVSFGSPDEISEQLDYLKSLKIFDIPKKTPQYSGDGITI